MDKNIEEMSIDELKEYADMLNVSYAANIGKETLLAKVKTVLGEPEEEAEPAHPSVVKDDERVTIIIGTSESDKQPVPVSVNGRNYVMQRGKEVSVPPCVLEVLDHAVKQVWDSEMKEYSKVKRYPYQVVVK